MPILRQIAQLGQPVLRGVAMKVDNPTDPAAPVHAPLQTVDRKLTRR